MNDERPQDAGQTRSVTAFLIVAFGTFGLQLLTLVSGVITARLLGVEGRGLAALIFALGTFGSQLSFGASLPVALAASLAERRLTARDALRSIARRWWWVTLLPGLVTGGIMLALYAHDLTGETFVWALGVAIITFQTITFRILVGALQGEAGQFARMAVVALMPQFFFTSLLAVAWVAGWGWGVEGVLWSFVGASFLGIGAGFFALSRPTGRPEDELEAGPLWAETKRLFFGSMRPLDSLGLDRILVGALMGAAALGLYAVAIAVASIGTLVGSAVSVIVLPRVARERQDLAAMRRLARQWTVAAASLLVLSTIALEVILDPAIRLVFGEEFAGAIPVARWVLVGMGLLGLRLVLVAILQGAGHGGSASWIELALTPVMVVGVVVAAALDEVTWLGYVMTVVGALGCVTMGTAVLRALRAPAPADDVPAPDRVPTFGHEPGSNLE